MTRIFNTQRPACARPTGAALAVFLLFAAVLLAVAPAEASLPKSAGTEQVGAVALADASAPLERASLTSSRFGLGEDLSVFDAPHAQLELGLCGQETRRCEITYARNNPVRLVDPDGRAAKLAPGMGKSFESNADMRLAVNVALSSNPAMPSGAAMVADTFLGMLFPGSPQEAFDNASSSLMGMGMADAAAPEARLLAATARNFRGNLMRWLGKSAEEVAGQDAHHMLPQAERLAKQFSSAGLNVHEPKWGAFLEHGEHLARASEFNADWSAYLSKEHTAEEIQKYARVLAAKYDITW